MQRYKHLIVLAVTLSAAGSAIATIVPIVNPGFEQVQVSSSDPTPVTLTAVTVGGLQSVYYYNGAVGTAWVPGWSAPADGPYNFKAGLQHNPNQFSPGFPIGNNELFVNGVVVGQTLVDTLASNMTYILSVDVARRNDFNFGGYTVSLLAGSTVLGSDTGSALSLSPGAHLTSTVIVYSHGLSPSLIGQPLRIELTGPANNQAHFDNVQLLAIPEPSTILLFSCGAVLVVWRRRGGRE